MKQISPDRGSMEKKMTWEELLQFLSEQDGDFIVHVEVDEGKSVDDRE